MASDIFVTPTSVTTSSPPPLLLSPMSSNSIRSSNTSGEDNSDDMPFDICDFLAINDEAQEEQPALLPTPQHLYPVVAGDDAEGGGGGIRGVNDNDQAGGTHVGRNTATSAVPRVAFRTKTELEMLEDGYKWRKYGKKKVKNSPNPRNYYRCSSEGCNVKKRVEREPKDPSYLLTTYEGVHNHHAPFSQ